MKRLNGSTIIETIVAMILLLITTGIFVELYSKILSHKSEYLMLKVENILNEVSIVTKIEKKYLNEEISEKGIIIRKSFTRYNDSYGLIEMSLTAIDTNGKILVSRKEIILE